jgi:hypothetical protein
MGPTGPATDASFYTKLNWNWLREADGPLRTITRNGRELPLDLIAGYLRDPAVQGQLENSTPEQQIAYIQRQCRGFELTREEVETSFALISLHEARQELRNLQYTAGATASALTNCFDENGALRSGRESDLLAQIFPEQNVNGEQVLALRRVALARRILELRQNDPAGELAAYDRVARQIGLIDAQGNLSGSETQLAQASLESHPPAIVPAALPRSTITPSQVIMGIMAQGAHG